MLELIIHAVIYLSGIGLVVCMVAGRYSECAHDRDERRKRR